MAQFHKCEFTSLQNEPKQRQLENKTDVENILTRTMTLSINPTTVYRYVF